MRLIFEIYWVILIIDKRIHMKVILPVSAKKSSTYLFMSAALSGYWLGAYGATPSLGSGLTSVLLTFVMFAVAWPAGGPFAPPWPTLIFGRPTILEPTLPRGDTECTLGCTSVVPVPDIAPTGLFICNEDVFAVFWCMMLSTVFSMKTRLFLMISPLPLPCGEFVLLWCWGGFR